MNQPGGIINPSTDYLHYMSDRASLGRITAYLDDRGVGVTMTSAECVRNIPAAVCVGDTRYPFMAVCGAGTFGLVCRYQGRHVLKLIFRYVDSKSDGKAQIEKAVCGIIADRMTASSMHAEERILVTPRFLFTKDTKDPDICVDVFHMPYIGENLTTALITRPRASWDVPQCWYRIKQIVEHLQSLGVWVVDLKPGNILICDETQNPVMCDAGGFVVDGAAKGVCTYMYYNVPRSLVDFGEVTLCDDTIRYLLACLAISMFSPEVMKRAYQGLGWESYSTFRALQDDPAAEALHLVKHMSTVGMLVMHTHNADADADNTNTQWPPDALTYTRDALMAYMRTVTALFVSTTPS